MEKITIQELLELAESLDGLDSTAIAKILIAYIADHIPE